MEHLFHLAIPGTPENAALLSALPALAPMQVQIANLVRQARRWLK